MKTISEVKRDAKDTVGYAEATNKDSFMTGVSVGYSICESEYEEHIKTLREQVEYYKTAHESLSADMSTLTKIISKHTNENP